MATEPKSSEELLYHKTDICEYYILTDLSKRVGTYFIVTAGYCLLRHIC